MGLYKLKVQALSFRPEEKGNSRKAKEDYRYSRKISYEEEILESITGCKHPLISSGATTIGSARRAPNEIKQNNNATW
jgi:hypothetical protein